MEELLKRVAQERREKAGAEFELHPATRGLLQGEVARTYPKSAPKRSFLFFLWPRLALMGIFTALLALTVLVLNTPRNSQPAFELSQRADSPAPNALESWADPVKENRLSDGSAGKDDLSKNSVAPTESPSFFREVGGSQSADRLQAAKGGRAEPAPAQLREQPARTEKKSEELADKQLAANSGPANVRDEAAAAPASAPAIMPPARALNPDVSTAATPIQALGFAADASSARRKFVQQDLRSRFRQNLLSPPPSKILQTFEFARDGNRIQFFDSDGSVYVGELLPQTQATAKNQPGVAGEHSGFAFRAAGTNLQIRRLVTINGTLSLPDSGGIFDTKTLAPTVGALNEGKVKSESAASGKVIGSIKAKISVGGTNQFEMEAIEVTR